MARAQTHLAPKTHHEPTTDNQYHDHHDVRVHDHVYGENDDHHGGGMIVRQTKISNHFLLSCKGAAENYRWPGPKHSRKIAKKDFENQLKVSSWLKPSDLTRLYISSSDDGDDRDGDYDDGRLISSWQPAFHPLTSLGPLTSVCITSSTIPYQSTMA